MCTSIDLVLFIPVFQYQKEQVDLFCKKHGMDDIKYQLPTRSPTNKKWDEPYFYNRHLLIDPNHQLLFCFVPKVGCTNLKLLIFTTLGAIPRTELGKSRDTVSQPKLELVMKQNSFIYLPEVTKKAALNTYTKYTIYRNPLERLASSYRSKVERYPLFSLKADNPHFNWLRKDIYSATHKDDYTEWEKDNGRKPINITFSDFIDYWLSHPIINKVDGYYDEHFLMISDMCQPCRTRFDFYGNFAHFDRDAKVLMDRIGASPSQLRGSYYSPEASTEKRMKQYYRSLSEQQKIKVIKKMALELEFHYTIFPEEKDCHKQILEIDVDLPAN